MEMHSVDSVGSTESRENNNKKYSNKILPLVGIEPGPLPFQP